MGEDSDAASGKIFKIRKSFQKANRNLKLERVFKEANRNLKSTF
jgi:hypothetical protein